MADSVTRSREIHAHHALVAEVERLRSLHKDRAALIRAVGAAQDAGDEHGVELTRSDLEPIIRAALEAAIGGEQR